MSGYDVRRACRSWRWLFGFLLLVSLLAALYPRLAAATGAGAPGRPGVRLPEQPGSTFESPVNIGSRSAVGPALADPDLWLAAGVQPEAAAARTNVVVTLRYGNQGSGPASSTVVTAALPSGLGPIEAFPAPASQTGGALAWDTGVLNGNSETFTIQIVTQVTPAMTVGSTVTITAGISGAEPGSNPANTSAGVPLFIGYRLSCPILIQNQVAP
jgi:hypothetical protein